MPPRPPDGRADRRPAAPDAAEERIAWDILTVEQEADVAHLVPDRLGTPRLVVTVRVPCWPDLELAAEVIGPPRSDPRTGNQRPLATLYWIDGPAPVEVSEVLDPAAPDSPFSACRGLRLQRALSDVGVAASVIVHQQLYGRPYTDPTAFKHGMARVKIAAVRDLERRNRGRRIRLEDLQRRLLSLSLPPIGVLSFRAPSPKIPDIEVEGAELWTLAATLVAISPGRDVSERTAHQPGRDPSRRLAATLAEELTQVGVPTLETLSVIGS